MQGNILRFFGFPIYIICNWLYNICMRYQFGEKTEGKDVGLERLCKAYLNLDDGEKEKIIGLGEGLLSSQKTIDMEKIVLAGESQPGHEHRVV